MKPRKTDLSGRVTLLVMPSLWLGLREFLPAAAVRVGQLQPPHHSTADLKLGDGWRGTVLCSPGFERQAQTQARAAALKIFSRGTASSGMDTTLDVPVFEDELGRYLVDSK